MPFDDVEVCVVESGGLNCYEDLLGPWLGGRKVFKLEAFGGICEFVCLYCNVM